MILARVGEFCNPLESIPLVSISDADVEAMKSKTPRAAMQYYMNILANERGVMSFSKYHMKRVALFLEKYNDFTIKY